MPRIRASLIVAAFLTFAPAVSAAASPEGSAPLVCAARAVHDCDETGDCARATPELVNLPAFVRIDPGSQTIATVGPDGRSAPIRSLAREDGRLILHGAQNGRAWTIVIAEDSGQMSATVIEDGFAFTIFGACTPLEGLLPR